jgi:uncharacterized protein (TIGR03067 family)
MRHLRGLLSLAVALLLLSSGHAGDDAKKALEGLSGDWKIVKLAGAVKAEKVEGVMTFSGDELNVKSAGVTLKVALDPSKKPQHMDLSVIGEDKQVLGIYKVEKDTLTICVTVDDSKERPTAFAVTETPRTVLVVLDRVK